MTTLKRKSKAVAKQTNQRLSVVVKERRVAPITLDYAPSIESADIVKIKTRNSLFINGKFVAPKSGEYFDSINPATGKKISELALANKADVNAAVAAAREAYGSVWSKMKPAERSRYLFRIARLVQERSRELAVLETIDNGKSIRETRDFDIPQVAAHFFYHAGWADKLDYAFPGKSVAPLGVVGQVIPWNFPLLMAAWKIAPALACGNTVVIKPAETTSLSLLALCEIFQEAGLPDGAVNVVTGAGETGAALLGHDDINKIAFTGSTEVGKIILRNAAGTKKRLTMELGGKSAHIVFADAAIDQAVESVINGIYFNQGHVCCAGSRLLLEEPIADLFIKKLKLRMTQLRVGNPLDKNTDIGAINSVGELEKIKRLVSQGQKEGGDYFEPMNTKLPATGYFHKPCFFAGVSSSFSLSRTEVFGPVLVISTFRTPAEAVAKANDTPYGLAAGIWSDRAAKIHKVAGSLKAGVVWANTYNKFDPTSPFGGFNESGFGREGGRHGLMAYLDIGGK